MRYIKRGEESSEDFEMPESYEERLMMAWPTHIGEMDEDKPPLVVTQMYQLMFDTVLTRGIDLGMEPVYRLYYSTGIRPWVALSYRQIAGVLFSEAAVLQTEYDNAPFVGSFWGPRQMMREWDQEEETDEVPLREG